jgi:hypothetical protein
MRRSIKFADVMLERGYNGIRAYGSLHPGTYIDTAMVRDAGIKPITVGRCTSHPDRWLRTAKARHGAIFTPH